MLRFDIVMDARENPRKCTVAPLASRADFHMIRLKPGQVTPALASDILLHVDGVPLDRASLGPVSSVAVIDCYWRRCRVMLQQIEKPWPTLVRIPEGFVTAYPRRSKLEPDPDGGLATIEAIFIAAAFLGHWDESLLCKYHFGDEFLSVNRPVFASYKLGP